MRRVKALEVKARGSRRQPAVSNHRSSLQVTYLPARRTNTQVSVSGRMSVPGRNDERQWTELPVLVRYGEGSGQD